MNVFEAIPRAWDFASRGPVIVYEAQGERARFTTESLIRYYGALKFLEGYNGPDEGLLEALTVKRIEERASLALTEAAKGGKVAFKAVA
jgi:hypothetical protein